MAIFNLFRQPVIPRADTAAITINESTHVRIVAGNTVIDFYGNGLVADEAQGLTAGPLTGMDVFQASGEVLQLQFQFIGLSVGVPAAMAAFWSGNYLGLFLSGDDIINGSSLPERLHGWGGQDALHGNGGNDTLVGSYPFTDTLYGGPGDDRYEAYPTDTIVGSPEKASTRSSSSLSGCRPTVSCRPMWRT